MPTDKTVKYFDNLLCFAHGPIYQKKLAHLFFDDVVTMTITPPFSSKQEQEQKEKEKKEYDELLALLKPLKQSRHSGQEARETGPHIQCVGEGLRLDFKTPVFVWNPNDTLYPITHSNSENEEGEPFLSLSNIPTIRDSVLTNEQIFELRKDVINTNKIRRLRKFFYENYQDKPASYIEDDLMVRIEDFRFVAKQYNLDLLDSTFSISGTNKLLLGAMAGITSSVAGLPLKESIAIGLTSMIGSTLLKIGTNRKRQSISKDQNPISYLIDINEKSNKNKANSL